MTEDALDAADAMDFKNLSNFLAIEV